MWGDTDASVGDEATYEQYESADGTQTFFIEDWIGTKSGAKGKKIAASAITTETASPAEQMRMMADAQKNKLRRIFRKGIVTTATAIYAVIIFLLICGEFPDLGARSWHDFRNFIGLPYALHERLSDAPYYTEETGENGTRVYTARIDAPTAALDLIEGVDGDVQDAMTEETNAGRVIVLRKRTEIARIAPASDGTARIVLTENTAVPAPSRDRDRLSVLLQYGDLVRTGDTRGRAALSLEQSTATSPSTAAKDTETAALKANVPPTADEAPRRNLHIIH